MKGLYFEIRKEIPPKTHSLVYLLTELSIRPPENHGRFIVRLSEASIPTRYPESLAVAQKDFTSSIVKEERFSLQHEWSSW